jgi:YfiH family protein
MSSLRLEEVGKKAMDRFAARMLAAIDAGCQTPGTHRRGALDSLPLSLSILKSRLLPVLHGFTTRHGGVSTGAFASLNVSTALGDSPGNVGENLARIAGTAGIAADRIATVSQVHGASIERAAEGDAAALAVRPADAVWTDTPGIAVAVKTADCVPVLLADPAGRVAAVHSGWRGTDLEVCAAAVAELCRQGARPDQLVAAIGPCIRACCYEVSDELAARFRERFGSEVIAQGGGTRPHLDLVRAIRATLRRSGLESDRIDVIERCTACEAEDFFSHRRDGGTTGRHLSFAVCAF